MRKLFIACFAFTGCLASPAFAECNVQRFSFFPGGTTESNMTVTSGKNCGVVVHAGGQSRFDNVGIAAQPKHGTLSPRAGVGVTYRSAAGFKGEDSFVYTVTGKMRTGTGTATIKIRVSVI
jgi:hypothetical protein